jgi:hypothetical protein
MRFSDAVATMLRSKLDAIVITNFAVAGLKTKGAVSKRRRLFSALATPESPTR